MDQRKADKANCGKKVAAVQTRLVHQAPNVKSTELKIDKTSIKSSK
jgi:hypothetical protein